VRCASCSTSACHGGWATLLAGHEVSTVPREGWASTKNGRLLALAERKFDVFLTHDGSLDKQQNVSRFDLAIIALRAPSNDITDLLPLVPEIPARIPTARKGKVTVISN
jgi:hypothetical protein